MARHGEMVSSFSTRDVAELLGTSPAQVRRLARSGFFQPSRGPRGEYVFSFQDVALLRTALELMAARIPARRVRRALLELRRQVPAEQPLSAVCVAATGDEVIARVGSSVWNPESGQTHFDLLTAESTAPVSRTPIAGAAPPARTWDEDRDAEEWYEHASALEETDADAAEAAYRAALTRSPEHRGAHLGLGYLLHQSGRLGEAVTHYRAAAEGDPDDGTAAFNLGVALEDAGRPDEAMHAYRRAITADPQLADAHFNLGRLCDEKGERTAAFEHLRQYRRLMGAGGGGA